MPETTSAPGAAAVLLFGFCLGAGTPADAAPDSAVRSPDDYAYGWLVIAPAPAQLYELRVPIGVYRAALDPGLRDLAVFDADGEPVPRLVREPAAPAAVADQTLPLAVLPVWASPGQAAGDVRLTLDRRDGGTQLALESTPPPGSGAQALVAYVADAGESQRSWRSIDLQWNAAAGPLLLPVTVEGSADLNAWYPLGSGTVAALQQDGARIERRRVELADRAARYLRITWSGAPAEWRLERVDVQWSQATPAVPLERLRLVPVGRDANDGGYLFDSGGAPLTREFALELPADNVVVGARVYRRGAGSGDWEPVHAGVFYHLRREGADLQRDPVTVAPRRAARWKVVIDRGRAELNVSLVLGWQPDRLVFVAQGAAPWLVAAGSALDLEQGFPQARRYSEPELVGLMASTGQAAPASLGQRRDLGGAEQLRPARVQPWGRWLLWLGLVGGVAVVAFMVLRLLRQLRPQA